MADKKPKKEDEEADQQSASKTGEATLTSAGEVEVSYTDTPPKGEEGKKIHPRRPMPPVPEAKQGQEEQEEESAQQDSSKPDKE